MIDQSVIDAFWARVDKNGPIPEHAPELGPCWVWTGPLSQGYGVFKRIPGIQGAHRAAYVIEHGSIPRLAYACHKCDRKSCCRPSHIYAGDTRSNITDAINRGQRVYTALWHRHPVQLTPERWATAIVFRDVRVSKQMTRTAMCERIGAYPALLERMEDGMVAARPEHWRALARIAGRSRAALISSAPPFPSVPQPSLQHSG